MTGSDDGLARLITEGQVDGKVSVELARRVLALARSITIAEVERRDTELAELRREVARLRDDVKWTEYH